MAHASLPVSRGYLLAGAAVAAGLYLVRDDRKPAAIPEPTVAAEPARQMSMIAPPLPTLLSLRNESESEPELGEPEQSEEIEEVRGHAEIEDPAEFAMVFEVDGTSYLRLSTEMRASARGKPRMVVDGEVNAVIAPVAVSALPEAFATWNGRTVLVNGSCRARVVGFAEVSRISGEPYGSEDYWSAPEDERPAEQPTWNADDIVENNVTLAAKLDGCSGTWARSADYEPVQIARVVESSDLEAQAISDLLAHDGNHDPIQDGWAEQGGEGNWRDVANVEAMSYVHPVTGETWIFASAYVEGGCGDPSISEMSAYRVDKNGRASRFADLDFAGQTIRDVVDLDGDGQPELLLGSGSSTDLVDLKNASHDSISVPYNYYGCGC